MTILILSALFACSGEPAPEVTPEPEPVVEAPPVAPAVPESVLKAVTIADAIEKEPTRVDAILAENGTTRDAYEASLYEIAADPELSASYAAERSN